MSDPPQPAHPVKSLSEPRSPRDKALRARKLRDTLQTGTCSAEHHPPALTWAGPARQADSEEGAPGVGLSPLTAAVSEPLTRPPQPSPESGQPRRVGSSRGSHKLKTSEGTPGGEHCLSPPATGEILPCL